VASAVRGGPLIRLENADRPWKIVCGSGPRGRKRIHREAPLPNSLVHFAVQGAATRGLGRGIDPRWIYLGCVLPDTAWIVRRAAAGLGLPVDPIDLRLYAMAQASLAGSLVLCAAVALCSRRPRLVFGVLGVNASLHLLLDACERKWGNGVHLLAPFDWSLTRFDLFPNDGGLNLILTAAGALLVAVELLRGPARAAPGPALPSWRRGAAALLGLVYLAAPLLLMPAVLESDSYSVRTLRERERRAGRRVGLDRVWLLRGADGPQIALWTGERVRTAGELPEGELRISLEGRFLAPDLLLVENHAVQGFDRDLPSYAGLALLALLWLRPFARRPEAGHAPP
jgi:hypothetical protein